MPKNVEQEFKEMESVETELREYMEKGAVILEEWRGYVSARYDETKVQYRMLTMQKREAVEQGRTDIIEKLLPVFRSNLAVRKWAVTELRQLGEKIEDPFIR